MPYIEAKMSVKLNDNQKDSLQKKLTDAVSSTFGKPKAYIMTNIEDNKALYMAERKLEKGAYIAISLLGAPSKSACQSLTQEICAILQSDFGIDDASVYVTYHPTDLWGWNNSMF
ncbi:MAG: phenylpyruvate tautomerase MIF-related protein [Alphaproteobacteria bacterium]|nr:phenylpyruvate tautomerase MIF-related protein [Alphaproteobacteria bacterium]